MIRKILSTMLLFLVMFHLLPVQVQSAPPLPRQVTVVLVNHLSLEELRQMEKMQGGGWMSKGSTGALNLRTAGEMDGVNNAITLGSGKRSLGPAKSTEAYSGFEQVDGIRAVDWYEQLTGSREEEGAVFVPAYKQILQANAEGAYVSTPGLLGDTLHRHGLTTAVIGNSDLGEQKVRFAPLMAMDGKGVVDQGDVSSLTNRPHAQRLYGMATNYTYLLQRYEGFRAAGTSLIVLELGDLYRLYSMKRAMDDLHFAKMKASVLSEMNGFMTQLVSRQGESELILFLSPMVNPDAQQEKSLMSPFVQISPNHTDGILYTPSTRQPGIVSNMDIAPTILQWLQIPVPPQMEGRAMTIVQGEHPFWSDWEEIKHIYATRPQVLYGYVTFQIVVLILAAALWFFARPGQTVYRQANRLVCFLLLVLTMSPFLFLVLPMFPTIREVPLTVLFLIVLGTALAAALVRLPFPVLFFVISLINWVPVLFDGIWGESMLMKRSYLGYDPVIGARFYGIGNEYMGVVIGSSILSLAMLLEMMKKRERLLKAITMGVFGLYLVFFALPGWGTNAGGALTAVTAYSVSFVRLFDIQLNRKYLFWGGLSITIALCTLFLVNMSGDEQSQSHIGRAMGHLLSGDWREISSLIERKLEMNLKLIGVSSWSKVFITSILVLGLLCYRPAGVISRISEKYPYAVRGFFGIIIGAFTALIFNDSGIVAAATAIVYMVIPLLYLGLQEKMSEAGSKIN